MAESDTVIVSKDKLKEVIGILEIVRAVQTLEYFDKNQLSGHNESRSRERVALLTEGLSHLQDIIKR